MEPAKHQELGAWIGRQQAFTVIAGSCQAARAQCLKQVRESKMLDDLGLTWENFCKDYVGITRQHADDLIRHHEAFGDAYFRLSQIARVSATTYQKISNLVDGDTIEIDGQKLTLTPDNAPRIRAAIQALRSQSKPSTTRRPSPEIVELQVRVNALADDIYRAMQALGSDKDHEADRCNLRALAIQAMNKFRKFAREPESANPSNH